MGNRTFSPVIPA